MRPASCPPALPPRPKIPYFTGQRTATALIHRCVADCRTQGAGPIVIVADLTDTPKRMYAAMGFRPVALKRSYWKNIDH